MIREVTVSSVAVLEIVRSLTRLKSPLTYQSDRLTSVKAAGLSFRQKVGSGEKNV